MHWRVEAHPAILPRSRELPRNETWMSRTPVSVRGGLLIETGEPDTQLQSIAMAMVSSSNFWMSCSKTEKLHIGFTWTSFEGVDILE